MFEIRVREGRVWDISINCTSQLAEYLGLSKDEHEDLCEGILLSDAPVGIRHGDRWITVIPVGGIHRHHDATHAAGGE